MRLPKNGPPVTPGKILLNEFLLPLGISQSELATRLVIPFQRINQIVTGKRTVTSDTALRLARMFGTTPELWLNLQQAVDLYIALHSPEASSIKRIKPVIAA